LGLEIYTSPAPPSPGGPFLGAEPPPPFPAAAPVQGKGASGTLAQTGRPRQGRQLAFESRASGAGGVAPAPFPSRAPRSPPRAPLLGGRPTPAPPGRDPFVPRPCARRSPRRSQGRPANWRPPPPPRAPVPPSGGRPRPAPPARCCHAPRGGGRQGPGSAHRHPEPRGPGPPPTLSPHRPTEVIWAGCVHARVLVLKSRWGGAD